MKKSKFNVEKVDDELMSLCLPEEIQKKKLTNNKSSDRKLKYLLSFIINLSGTKEAQDNGYCYVTDSSIVKAIGCSKSYVETYAKVLLNLGYLKDYKRGSLKSGKASRFYLNDELFPKVSFVEDENCTTSPEKCTSSEKVYHNITEYNINECNVNEYNIKENNENELNVNELNKIKEKLNVIDELMNKINKINERLNELETNVSRNKTSNHSTIEPLQSINKLTVKDNKIEYPNWGKPGSMFDEYNNN